MTIYYKNKIRTNYGEAYYPKRNKEKINRIS